MQNLLAQIQTEVSAADFIAAKETSLELAKHATVAADQVNDPLWSMAEFTPFAGSNFAAVRVVANTINDFVEQVAVPGVTVLGNVHSGDVDPTTGGFDLAQLSEASTVVVSANSIVKASQSQIASTNRSFLVGPVSAAVAKLDDLLSKAAQPLASASSILGIADSVLGAEGPRTYLLAFLNNAEVMPLGGSSAALSVISADHGVVKIIDQSSSADLLNYDPVDVTVDQNAIDLFTSYLVTHSNTATSRPDFPTAGEILKAHYLRERGIAVDGVVSLDPLALAYILKATGAITLSTGDVLSSDNAVTLLLNGAYFRWNGYTQTKELDAFFAEVTREIFARVSNGKFNVGEMVNAIGKGIAQGSVMAWFVDPAEEAALDDNRLQGTLPKNNDQETVLGVYYRDISASKMDYYLQTATTTTADLCPASQPPSFVTTATLHSEITPEQARTLPDYVMSRTMGTQKFATQVFVYGPVGAALTSATVVSQGIQTTVNAGGLDLGRPVASFTVFLQPGETSTVSAVFTGAEGKYGPLQVRGTPMIKKTDATVTQSPCSK